jgi:hypothetical protein
MFHQPLARSIAGHGKMLLMATFQPLHTFTTLQAVLIYPRLSQALLRYTRNCLARTPAIQLFILYPMVLLTLKTIIQPSGLVLEVRVM